jgi:hypothetical protein
LISETQFQNYPLKLTNITNSRFQLVQSKNGLRTIRTLGQSEVKVLIALLLLTPNRFYQPTLLAGLLKLMVVQHLLRLQQMQEQIPLLYLLLMEMDSNLTILETSSTETQIQI